MTFAADNNTVILFLGGKKKNVADQRILCRYYQYEQDDPLINKSDPPFNILPHVILCFKDFVSHEASFVFKEKAAAYNIPFVIASGGLGSLVEQARLQRIDLSNVILGKPKTSATTIANGNGNNKGGISMISQPQEKASIPKHYNAEFRNTVIASAKQIKINDNMAVHVISNKLHSYSLLLRGSWLDEADRLATKYGCDGNSEIALERFVKKNVALKIHEDFSQIMGNRGIKFDYITIQKALNTYRNSETPDRFKKPKGCRRGKNMSPKPLPKPEPSKAQGPTPAPAPAPTPAPATAPTPELSPSDLSSVTSELLEHPDDIKKIEASVDRQIADVTSILREVRGKIQKRRSISGSNAIEIFLTEMSLHFRDEDETQRELIQLFKEYIKLNNQYAALKSEHDKIESQWLEMSDQIKIKDKLIETMKEDLKRWKAMAAAQS